LTEQRPPQLRLYLTGLVLLGELAHLSWEHFHGGVISHHLLHRADMPAISNWWGLLLLPVLTWFLTGRIRRRIALRSDATEEGPKLPAGVVAGFVGALLLGTLLSVAFTNHYDSVATYLFGAMLVLALLLPVYRAECVLGFVLGMNVTFGAVLPTFFGSIIGALSAVIHLVLRPILIHLWKWLKRMGATSA
jgi:hypothetical protein